MKYLLLLFAVAAPLLAQPCPISVDPGAVNAPSYATSGSVAVTIPTGCAWRVSSDSSWLAASSNQFSGAASFAWSVLANSSPQDRRGFLTITSVTHTLTVAVAQPAAVCASTLSPGSGQFGAAGGAGTFTVQTSCAWAAQTGSSWITAPYVSGSTGGAVSYSVAANPCAATRAGNVYVQVSGLPGQQFAVTQEGAPGTLALSQSAATAAAAASDGRFDVLTDSSCGWTAYTTVNWIQIVLGGSGYGNGSVVYRLEANAGAERTGVIQVGGKAFTVTQQAAAGIGPNLMAVVNSASYASGAVSPGEIVALGGTAMGPKDGRKLEWADASQQSIATTLAGVSVTFDGVAAPLLYVSAAQINTVAPYSLAGKASTEVQVRYNGLASNTLTLPVQAATPGLYSIDSSGAGSGAVLNQNYDVNDKFHPAARGSVVMIFCTGGGLTSPAVRDGFLTTVSGGALPWLTQEVSVTIGGLPANVWYKGGAPGSVAGLTQINAQVPAGVTPGQAVPVLVQVGAWTSQTNVTIAVQ